MHGENHEQLVICEKCGDVHAEWQREEVVSEQAGLNDWFDVVCPRCHSPNYKTADVKDYAACCQKLAKRRGFSLKLDDFNAIPYAWCLNTTPNDFLNAVEAIRSND